MPGGFPFGVRFSLSPDVGLLDVTHAYSGSESGGRGARIPALLQSRNLEPGLSLFASASSVSRFHRLKIFQIKLSTHVHWPPTVTLPEARCCSLVALFGLLILSFISFYSRHYRTSLLVHCDLCNYSGSYTAYHSTSLENVLKLLFPDLCSNVHKREQSRSRAEDIVS